MKPPALAPPAARRVTVAERFPQVRRVFGDLNLHADGELLALAFGSGGRLWSVEEPGVLRQWDAGTGQQLGWVFLTDLATLWTFRPDGRVLASAGDDVALWDVASGECLTVLAQPSWVTALAIEPHSGRVATGHDDGVVRVWDTASQELVGELLGHPLSVSAVAFSPDGRHVATAGEERHIHLWDIATGERVGKLVGHTDRIEALAWHPRGGRLLSAAWDTTARVWDLASGEPIILLNAHADQVTAMAFRPDGRLLACADSARALHVWDAEAYKVRARLCAHDEDVRCLAFSGDGSRLASGGADGVIHVWDPAAGRLLSARRDPLLERVSLAVSPDGSWLASPAGAAGWRLWDVDPGTRRHQVEDPAGLPVLAVSPDGHRLASGGADRRVRLWDTATGALTAVLEGQAGRVAALAFAPDGAVLASASAEDGTVWLWDVAAGKPRLVIAEAADNCLVQALAFHPQGKLLAAGGIDWLATGGSDGAIGLWDIAAPGLVAVLDGGTRCLAFHPSGRWLAAAALDDTVDVWDVAEQCLLLRLSAHRQAVGAIAYSPDGRWLVSGGVDRRICVWGAHNGRLVATLDLPTQIHALAFAGDGRSLFTGNGNATAYQLDVAALLRCKPARGTLPEAEPRVWSRRPPSRQRGRLL
jgi:WD40 repeat protein